MARLKKRLEKAVRKAARLASVAAPIAGGLVFGPLGAVGGTALGAGFSQVGTGNKRKRLKRTLAVGGASIGVAGAVSLLGGGGIAQSPFTTLFGRSGPNDTTVSPVALERGLDRDLSLTARDAPTANGSPSNVIQFARDVLEGGGLGSTPPKSIDGKPTNESIGAGMGSLFGPSSPGEEKSDTTRNLLLFGGVAAVLMFARKKG